MSKTNQKNSHKSIETIETKIGVIAVEATDKGISKVSILRRSEQIKPVSGSAKANKITLKAKKQLESYFSRKTSQFDLPMDVEGTPFQKKVWSALLAIPYGETRSYGQLAASIGAPKAARAVGMANNRNPLGIIVPCHRVVGHNGKLVGYAGGLSIKKALLDLESVDL